MSSDPRECEEKHENVIAGLDKWRTWNGSIMLLQRLACANPHKRRVVQRSGRSGLSVQALGLK